MLKRDANILTKIISENVVKRSEMITDSYIFVFRICLSLSKPYITSWRSSKMSIFYVRIYYFLVYWQKDKVSVVIICMVISHMRTRIEQMSVCPFKSLLQLFTVQWFPVLHSKWVYRLCESKHLVHTHLDNQKSLVKDHVSSWFLFLTLPKPDYDFFLYLQS